MKNAIKHHIIIDNSTYHSSPDSKSTVSCAPAIAREANLILCFPLGLIESIRFIAFESDDILFL